MLVFQGLFGIIKIFGGKMGVQQIATAAPLRGIPKGAAALLWHTTLLARYSVLYLCGEDRRRPPAGRAADAVCSMDADCFSAAKGTCPDNPRRRGIPFPVSPFAFHWLHTMRKAVL